MNRGTQSVLFRCDGSAAIGMGHVTRCLALADELRESQGISSYFAMRESRAGAAMVSECGYRVDVPQNLVSEGFSYTSWLLGLVKRTGAGTLVLDVRDDLPPQVVTEVRKMGCLAVTIDDPTERRLLVDLAFYPPVPQVDRMNWPGFCGRTFVGWQWVPLRRDLRIQHLASREPNRDLTVLLTMGGSDPAGMTPKVLEFLQGFEESFDLLVAVGPAFSHRRELEEVLSNGCRNCRVEQSGGKFPSLMAEADLAIASFGVTAYELAAMGVPALYLCLTEDHVESASAFVKAGLGISLGHFCTVQETQFHQKLRLLLTQEERRLTMAQKASQTIDGLGAWRIAQLIAEHFEKRVHDD